MHATVGAGWQPAPARRPGPMHRRLPTCATSSACPLPVAQVSNLCPIGNAG